MTRINRAEKRGWNDFIEWNDACPYDSMLEPELSDAWKRGYEAAAADDDAQAASLANADEDSLVDEILERR